MAESIGCHPDDVSEDDQFLDDSAQGDVLPGTVSSAKPIGTPGIGTYRLRPSERIRGGRDRRIHPNPHGR